MWCLDLKSEAGKGEVAGCILVGAKGVFGEFDSTSS
jgi:hypothetical protein